MFLGGEKSRCKGPEAGARVKRGTGSWVGGAGAQLYAAARRCGLWDMVRLLFLVAATGMVPKGSDTI